MAGVRRGRRDVVGKGGCGVGESFHQSSCRWPHSDVPTDDDPSSSRVFPSVPDVSTIGSSDGVPTDRVRSGTEYIGTGVDRVKVVTLFAQTDWSFGLGSGLRETIEGSQRCYFTFVLNNPRSTWRQTERSEERGKTVPSRDGVGPEIGEWLRFVGGKSWNIHGKENGRYRGSRTSRARSHWCEGVLNRLRRGDLWRHRRHEEIVRFQRDR